MVRKITKKKSSNFPKRLLAMPHLWEDSGYVKVAKHVRYRHDMVSSITTQALTEVLEETIKSISTKMYGERELKDMRQELRKLYYKKACRVSRTVANPLLMDALDDDAAEKGIINAHGRGGEKKGALSDADVLALMLTIKYGLNVTRLILNNNEITDFGLWHISYLMRIGRLPRLTLIDVAENDITDRGIAIFADSFKDHQILKTVILKGNKMSEYGGLNFVSAFKQNEHLIKLDLTDTDMEMKTLVALLVVVTYHPTLQTLKIGRPLVFSEQEEPLIHLCQMFKINSVLRKVSVPKFSITDFGISLIVPGLKCNSTLVHLDLSCNRIVWDGAKLLSDFIKITPSLQVINLNANRLEDVGAYQFARALTSPMVSLKVLIVTNNNIGARGLCALASSIKNNVTLTHFYVWGNKMEGKACLALSSLLTSKRLKSKCVDFIPYKTVDGIVQLALARN